MQTVEILILLLHVRIEAAEIYEKDLRLETTADESSYEFHLLDETILLVSYLIGALIECLLHNR